MHTLHRLRREHDAITALLDDLQRVLADGETNAPLVLAEIERLTGELERHLRHEEEQLLPVLDAR